MTRSNFGSIEKRGTDTWRIWWTAGGQRHSKTIHGPKSAATKELARIQVETEGLERDATWAEYWELRVQPSFARDGLDKKTVDDYEGTWRRHLAPHIAARWVSQTSALVVESTLAKIPAGPAVKAGRLWKKMCRMAMRDGALVRDPFLGYRVRVPAKRAKRLLAADEVIPWMAMLEGSKAEPVLLCELGGGLRHEEACALTWEDVEAWEYRGVTYAVLNVSKALVTAKGGKYLKDTKTAFSDREVVVGEPFASRLLVIRATGPLCASGKVDNADPATPYTCPGAITRNYKGWCERRGVDYIKPANLRSTFATLHGDAGSPDSLVSGAMGHADATTKARNYQAITRRGLALIADNLAELITMNAPERR